MKIVVNLGPVNNNIDDPNWFIGTGFWGEQVSSHEELKTIIKKFWVNKNGEQRPFKMTFSSGEIIERIKATGNEITKKDQSVDMIALGAGLKDDPLKGYTLLYAPWGFRKAPKAHWLLISDNDKSETFLERKLSEILPLIGIKF